MTIDLTEAEAATIRAALQAYRAALAHDTVALEMMADVLGPALARVRAEHEAAIALEVKLRRAARRAA